MFITPLDTFDHRPLISNGQISSNQVVNQNWIFWGAEGLVYGVPPGLVYNLASRPAFSEFYLPKLGRTQRPSAIHDLFYILRVNGKRWSDIQYFKACVADGVTTDRNWIMRGCLTLFGWLAWWSDDDFIVVGSGNRRITDPVEIERYKRWANGITIAEARVRPEFTDNVIALSIEQEQELGW